MHPALSPTTRRDFVLRTAGALTAVAILPDLSFAAPRMADGPVTIGLIGAGRQGRLIITELAKFENVKIVGICDTDASRRDSGSKRAAGAEAFADHNAMLDKLKDLAAVIIATPTHLHKQIALDCLSAGKHIYCEAPLANTIEDCKAIAAAASTSKQIFAVGFEGRSNPVYKLARTFFRSDAVRDFVGAEAQSFKKETWRFPAPPGSDSTREKAENWRLDPEISLGLAGEMGAQQFDVVHWYTDQAPTSVFGAGGIRMHSDGRTLADSIHCDFGYDNGSRFAYAASLANSFGGRHETLRGTNSAIKLAWSHGWLFKEADAPTQGWEVYANRQQFFNDEGITLIADATKLAAQGNLKDGVGLPHKSLYYALGDFLKSITEAKPVACSAATGARSTTIAILAAKAVAESTLITIDPATLKF